MKTYAIADLHGRFDLFIKAVEVIHEHRGDDKARLIVLGDYVDRGPGSANIIRAMRGWTNKDLQLLVLKGNHEDMMVQVCEQRAQLQWWVGNGGGTTLMSYGYENDELFLPLKPQLEDDMKWLKCLPVYIEAEKQIFVHGGINPDLPMSEQDEYRMMWQCYDRNRLGRDEAHIDTNAPKHVVHGHEQWAHGPILLHGRTDLDTFAWLTGRLAIGVFDDSQEKPLEILWAEGPKDPRYD